MAKSSYVRHLAFWVSRLEDALGRSFPRYPESLWEVYWAGGDAACEDRRLRQPESKVFQSDFS